MKKTIAILLVALVAVGSVFAAPTLSGDATVTFGYDFDEKTLGFRNGKNGLTATFEATTGESANEGDIYASIKAELTLTEKSSDFDGDEASVSGSAITIDTFEITEAKVVGNNWEVSILSSTGVPTFANAWGLNDVDDSILTLTKNADYAAPGVTVSFADWSIGAGLSMDFNEGGAKNANFSVKTPEFAIADGMTLHAGAGLGKKGGSGLLPVGIGLAFGIENDTLAANVATDAVIEIATAEGEETAFGIDVAADLSVSLVDFAAYYATEATVDDDNAEYVTYVDRAYTVTAGSTIEHALDIKLAADLADLDMVPFPSPLSVSTSSTTSTSTPRPSTAPMSGV